MYAHNIFKLDKLKRLPCIRCKKTNEWSKLHEIYSTHFSKQTELKPPLLGNYTVLHENPTDQTNMLFR